jgi:hypothetical protein
MRVIAATITAALWVFAYMLFAHRYSLPGKIVLPVILGVAGILALLLAIPFNPPPSPDCFEAIDQSRSTAEVEVDYVYCETLGTNIWESDSPQMLDANKELVADNFDRLMWAMNGSDEPVPLDSSVADGDAENVGYKLSHIYEEWPKYENQPFMVLGRVVAKNLFTDHDGRADWVYQLGAVRDASQVMYVRIVRPSAWEPEAAEDCRVALVEMIPIARGLGRSAVEANSLDVIYGLGTVFTCIPPDVLEMLDEDLYNSLTAEEREAWDEGGSEDSH